MRDECKGKLRHQKKAVQDQFLEMKDDLLHELANDLNEQTQGTLEKIDELEFKVSHLTSQTEVLEKTSADKHCAIDGLESSVKGMRGSCETLSRTVTEHDRISKIQSHQQSVEIISTKHDLRRDLVMWDDRTHMTFGRPGKMCCSTVRVQKGCCL